VADFVTVYIKEAHPTDEWQVPANETDSVCYSQPKTLEERRLIANDFVERFHYALPLVVDTMENQAEDTYAAWPERLYVIGAEGKILYKGAMGPQGFAPDEVDSVLRALPSQPAPTPAR
jgi:hypothetical protein